MKVEKKGKLTIVLFIFGSALVLTEVDDTPVALGAGGLGVAGSGFGTPAWGFAEEGVA